VALRALISVGDLEIAAPRSAIYSGVQRCGYKDQPGRRCYSRGKFGATLPIARTPQALPAPLDAVARPAPTARRPAYYRPPLFSITASALQTRYHKTKAPRGRRLRGAW